MQKLCILLLVPVLLVSCKKNSKNYLKLKTGLSTIEIPDTIQENLQPEMIPIDIFVPDTKEINADLLVLPGWRFSRMRWHMETEILKSCEKMGYRAIFPEMKITVYESEYFPETTVRWSQTPGGKWIKEIMLPELQDKYGLLLKGEDNFILGLSTGARGVVLIAAKNPDIFIAGAVLSGDFNQAEMQKNRLMTAIYGEYSRFKDRWEKIDNPENIIKSSDWDIPLYIGHGKKDNVVPFDQSASFYDSLTDECPFLEVKFNAPEDAGHNFKYWASEVGPVFDFFNSI